MSPDYGSREDERLECDHVDNENEDYWKCYWLDTNCLETAGDACWYQLNWNGECDIPAAITWENYLTCQAVSPSYNTKENERLECDQADTPNEDYWKCYWENTGCLETAGDACWHTKFWFDTCDEDVPSLDDQIEISWEKYLECQAISPGYGSRENERLECN